LHPTRIRGKKMIKFRNLTNKLFALICLVGFALTFSACKKDGSVTISKEDQLTQTAYADETTTGSGFTFTATDNWTATVKETTTIKGSGVSWIKLLCNGVETYNGGKGTYTMVISLAVNYTGNPRSANIEIASGNDKIIISVTQQGTTKDGEIPEPSNPALVSRILLGGDIPIDFIYDAQNQLSSINFGYTVVQLTYPSANTLLAIFEGEEWVFTLNNDGHIIKMEYPGGGGVLYEYENGYLKKSEGYIDYVWENGNLKSVQWESFGFTFSYNTIHSKETNIAPWTTPMLSVGGFNEGFYAYFPSAFFGKSSKNLVSSANDINFRYETNADGYVTKVYQQEVDELEEYLMYEIQYK